MRFQAIKENVKISGRTIYRDGVRYLGYSGTAVSFSFVGKKAVAHLISDIDQREEFHRAWVAVFIDDEDKPYKRFVLDQTEADYVLYESEEAKEVTLTIVKYSEPEYAVCGIAWLETDSDGLLSVPKAKQRKIQMVGDSITCGYGVEGAVTDEVHNTEKENPMKAYSLKSIRKLDAEVEIVAWNGKGVITEYIGDSDIPDATWLVPMLYKYTDAGCERDYFHRNKEKWEEWEHSQFEPDLITVFLGTNDASYVREITERHECFKKAYVAFLEELHRIHPKAAIMCMLGTMDQRVCPAVECAVREFSSNYKDVNIEYLHLPPQDEADGLGTFWHPSETTHEKVSELVVAKAKEMMNWE